MFDAVFDHLEHESTSIISFWFRVVQPISFIPGQYIEFDLPHTMADDRGITRWFTLTSTPNDLPMISFTTRYSNASSSFKRELLRLKKGSVIHLLEPIGDFVLPIDPSIPLFFIAGGIGATPFVSIVKWLHHNHLKRTISFMYAVENQDDLIAEELFSSYRMNRLTIVHHPKSNWQGQTGTLDGKRILDFVGHQTNSALIYLAGSDKMVDRLNKELIHLGVSRSNLVLDYYGGYEV